MAFADIVSQIVITAGALAAVVWSIGRAFTVTTWHRYAHGVTGVMMVVMVVAVQIGSARLGLPAALAVLATLPLIFRGDPKDRWRWLLMVEFIFALFVASGAPFRMLANG